MISQNLVPGGVVTTQNMSTVIRPKGNNNSLQFVKIQTPELSKSADEQIRLAEETNISKEKIKEVEEEWQNNLLNWKSKRRQQITQTLEHEPYNSFDVSDNAGGRKIKTFAEMIEQRAKSGNRLGFHLQRYLGENDDDEEHQASFARRENAEKEDDDFNDVSRNMANQVKNQRVDSDYEAHSSTSSGYNQLDSKSPSSPETSLDASKLPGINTPKCDSSHQKRDSLCDELDVRSISLVDSSQSNRLNSTPKQDMKPPVANLATSLGAQSKPVLEIDTKKKELPLTRESDESDNSGYEEEEEEEQEEEEQKHLQRVAFEAKLKAFEKLTKSSTQKSPEVTQKRVAKPPLLPPHHRQQPQQQQTQPQNKVQRNDSSLIERQLQLEQPPAPPRMKGLVSFNENPRTVHPMVKSELFQLSSNSSVATMPSTDVKAEDPLPCSVPPPAQTLTLSPKQTHPKPSHVLKTPPVLAHQSPTLIYPPPVALPHSQISAAANSPAKTVSTPPQDRSPIKLSPQANKSPQKSVNIPIPTIQQSNIQPAPQPLPETLKSTPNQRKSVRDDKDRNIPLSVSGKKRCSSCKEELGRGAAAFVVESLSLVYHTNCFRCSVCHVNLSNGFRGVDVRVHAGALHCQNCYSKDGLNYSRV